MKSVQIRWATAQAPARGETVCGDVYASIEHGTRVLFAVCDGAGHGPDARLIADKLVQVVRDADPGVALDALLRILDEQARGPRGAVASLLRFDREHGSIQFSGVGNVQLRSVGPSTLHPIASQGTLGRAARRVKVFEYQVAPGDFMVMFSDGIASTLDVGTYRWLGPSQAAERILRDHHRQIDDGTCLVIEVF